MSSDTSKNLNTTFFAPSYKAEFVDPVDATEDFVVNTIRNQGLDGGAFKLCMAND